MDTDMEMEWASISLGLSDIYACRPFEPLRYMKIQSTIFELCCCESEAAFAAELYIRLKSFIRRHVERISEESQPMSEVMLLDFYITKWLEFRKSSLKMDGLFGYLNRHFIKREMDEGNDRIYLTHTLALIVWRDYFFMNVHERLTHALLELIRQDRRGASVNKQLISDVITTYVELGIKSDDSQKSSCSQRERMEDASVCLYRKYFESKFLDVTEEFYLRESRNFLENGTIEEFMRKVENCLREENGRSELYLHPTTQTVLAERCRKALIEAHLPLFQVHFRRLLEARRGEDLQQMFMLCGLVANGLKSLKETYEEYCNVLKQNSATEGRTDSEYLRTLFGVDWMKIN